MIKCAVFQVVMTILVAISIGVFWFYGVVLGVIVFVICMFKVFDAGFVETIMIVVANVSITKGLQFLLLKMV